MAAEPTAIARWHQLVAARDRYYATARFALEDETRWSKLVGSGAVPPSSEGALFEWLGDARAPEFKAIHRLVV